MSSERSEEREGFWKGWKDWDGTTGAQDSVSQLGIGWVSTEGFFFSTPL